jgi:DnaK suppressor protein
MHAKWKAALERARAELVKAGPAKIEPNRTDASTVGVADEDAQALSEMLQTLASQQNKKSAETLKLIARALEKIASRPDDFGLCEECEEEIPKRRLELSPWVTLCTDCQAAKDPRRGVSRKSLTDYDR